MTATCEGRSVLVTGAASGIGQHLARELLTRGARVCAADINGAALETLRGVADERLLVATLDVRDAGQWRALVERIAAQWGRLDVLMNVAGVIRPGYIEAFSEADVHLQLDINSKGVIFGTQAATRQMLAQGSGQIINIASLAGIAPVAGLSLYSASKFAVRGFSLAAAFELRARGIQVTVICPDAVQTPMLDQQVDLEEAALTFSGSARALSVEDIGRAVFNEALPRAPLEITLPGLRGGMAKFASAFPRASLVLVDWLRERGRRQQRKRVA
jgi:NAD(P)-dependent dehydrogenase (short-subunit alcohol dehydrogenase family)